MITQSNNTLLLLGSSHHVADLSAREKISLPSEKIDEFYSGLKSFPGLNECLCSTPVTGLRFMEHPY